MDNGWMDDEQWEDGGWMSNGGRVISMGEAYGDQETKKWREDKYGGVLSACVPSIFLPHSQTMAGPAGVWSTEKTGQK